MIKKNNSLINVYGFFIIYKFLIKDKYKYFSIDILCKQLKNMKSLIRSKTKLIIITYSNYYTYVDLDDLV